MQFALLTRLIINNQVETTLNTDTNHQSPGHCLGPRTSNDRYCHDTEWVRTFPPRHIPAGPVQRGKHFPPAGEPERLP